MTYWQIIWASICSIASVDRGYQINSSKTLCACVRVFTRVILGSHNIVILCWWLGLLGPDEGPCGVWRSGDRDTILRWVLRRLDIDFVPFFFLYLTIYWDPITTGPFVRPAKTCEQQPIKMIPLSPFMAWSVPLGLCVHCNLHELIIQLMPIKDLFYWTRHHASIEKRVRLWIEKRIRLWNDPWRISEGDKRETKISDKWRHAWSHQRRNEIDHPRGSR